MVRRFLWVFLLVGLGFAACKQGGDYDLVRNLDSRGEGIICFGDSLTEGVGADRGGDYPSVLARELTHPILNAGKRGNTAGEGLSRVQRDVLAHNPRLVIVLFGGNDFLRRVPLPETKKNLDEIVRRILDGGAMVVLVGVKLGLFMDGYGSVYKEIAKKHGALVVPDILQGILSDPKLKSDSIHPNSDGYRLMAERIAKHVGPLLREADLKRNGTGSPR